MFDFYRVSAAVPDLKVADVSYNKDQMIRKINEAKENKANVIVFPELSLTGYTCGDLFFQQTLLANVRAAITDITEQTKEDDIIITFGAPLNINNQLYNTAITIYHGIIWGVSVKTFLPNYNEFYEKRWFSPANTLDCTELAASEIYDVVDDYVVSIGNNLIFNIPGKFKIGIELHGFITY